MILIVYIGMYYGFGDWVGENFPIWNEYKRRNFLDDEKDKEEDYIFGAI